MTAPRPETLAAEELERIAWKLRQKARRARAAGCAEEDSSLRVGCSAFASATVQAATMLERRARKLRRDK